MWRELGFWFEWGSKHWSKDENVESLVGRTQEQENEPGNHLFKNWWTHCHKFYHIDHQRLRCHKWLVYFFPCDLIFHGTVNISLEVRFSNLPSASDLYLRNLFFSPKQLLWWSGSFHQNMSRCYELRKEKMKLIMNQFWQGGSGLGVEKWCDVIGWEKNSFH